jgi:hypothetical protein
MADTEQLVEQVIEPVVEQPVVEQPLVEPVVEQPTQPPIQTQFLPVDTEFTLAKSFLTSKVGVKHPLSLYDHLTNVIMQSLETRNMNVVGIDF